MRYYPKAIESKWQKRWLKEKIYEPDFIYAKKPFYNLMMFPYPSAEGLHIGSVRTFTGIDIYGRFKRMQGYDVFEPIGLDGFGIHSENYALKIGKHPRDVARITEGNFYRQLGMIGNGFAWDERIQTYDPKYYRRTQWIFTQMFKRGLAYRAKAPVNWCPSCKTVLADEQVVAGKCERCETPVVKKELEQWFFKITAYAERLLKNLETIDWPQHIKIAQRNWIGKSEGALLKFEIRNSKSETNQKSQIQNSKYVIEVFTTRPDTLFGATYLVVAPEHPAIKNFQFPISNFQEVEDYIRTARGKSEEERIAEGKEKTGIELKGIKAINPATNEEISIWVADYVLGHVGTGAIMAVPAHDERDFEFAKKYNLPIKIVVCPHYPEKICPILDHAYEGDGHLVASGNFDGMPSAKARWEITQFVGAQRKIQYRLRDWLISRQRYWGPPIPMIYCKKCGWQSVPEEDLPIKLPYVEDFRPTGTDQSPLASVRRFYKVRCPQCDAWARRETDVSDTFLDSAWYYLGYLILGNKKSKIKNKKFNLDQNVIKKWLPVDNYIGGAEHAVLHLLYVRFCAMVFFDWGLTPSEEPFKKFRTHGLIMKDGAKMSKSKGNVVNPDEYISAYGTDAIRMYLAFLAPFTQGGDFRDTGVKGITRFLERTWHFVNSNFNPHVSNIRSRKNQKLHKMIHQSIKKITEDIERLQYNTAISTLMILLNTFKENKNVVNREDIKIFLKLLAPFAPYMTEELWQQMPLMFKSLKIKKFKSIHHEAWPVYDEKLIYEDTVEIVVQINGKVRGRITVPRGAEEDEVRNAALRSHDIKKYVTTPQKIIFVPNRLINFVV